MTVVDERLMSFLIDALPYRELVVSISRADERRLARHIESLNRDEAEPLLAMDPEDDIDLAVALMGCALSGMAAGEDEDGVWADSRGQAWDLPRPNRAPWRMRARFAWRAARRTWRAT